MRKDTLCGMASAHGYSVMSQSQGEADSRSWHSPPSMPSPIPYQGGSEAQMEDSALSAATQDSFGTGLSAQAPGMAVTAPQGYEWKYASTTPAPGWSEAAAATRPATEPTSAGHWSHAPGTWTQAGWQQYRASGQWVDYSEQPHQDSGWGPEYWRTAQPVGGSFSVTPASQWCPARQAAPAPGAKSGPPKGGGKCAQPGPHRSPPKARPQTESGSSPAQPTVNQKSEPGFNFNMNPYFQELPPGSPSFRLIQKLKELGLPRDPATWKKRQSLYFPEFTPPP